MSAAQAVAPKIRRRTSTPALLGIVNGNASGRFRVPRRDIAAAVRRAGGEIELVTTESVAELEAELQRASGRRVLVIGGDGTVHAVANLCDAPAELALLPAGSANNVARSLGIPLDPWAATLLAVSGRVRPVDLIEARTHERRYVSVESVSVGFLAQARVRYHARNSSDVLEALRAGVRTFADYRPLDGQVTSHDGVEHVRLGQLFVANLPLYEFGLHVAPHADPTDALLDFVGIEASGHLDVAVMLARLLRGSHLGSPGVHLWRAERARVVTRGASPIVADSEDLGFGPVELAVLPRALPLVRP